VQHTFLIELDKALPLAPSDAGAGLAPFSQPRDDPRMGYSTGTIVLTTRSMRFWKIIAAGRVMFSFA